MLFLSDPNDHVRNIRVIRLDLNGGTSWVQNYKACPFNPGWLRSHKIYSNLRYMGYANAKENNAVKWEDRITPEMLPAADPSPVRGCTTGLPEGGWESR